MNVISFVERCFRVVTISVKGGTTKEHVRHVC